MFGRMIERFAIIRPRPCLYAAAGVNNNPALSRLLLEAGARPDDCESLYHSTEHADLVCMRLLLNTARRRAECVEAYR